MRINDFRQMNAGMCHEILSTMQFQLSTDIIYLSLHILHRPIHIFIHRTASFSVASSVCPYLQVWLLAIVSSRLVDVLVSKHQLFAVSHDTRTLVACIRS